jgi:hypothetical protein
VCLIRFPEHDFNLIHGIVLGVFQENVESAATGLPSLSGDYLKISELQTDWVAHDLVLKPEFVVSTRAD